jgi:hypothetical protein
VIGERQMPYRDSLDEMIKSIHVCNECIGEAAKQINSFISEVNQGLSNVGITCWIHVATGIGLGITKDHSVYRLVIKCGGRETFLNHASIEHRSLVVPHIPRLLAAISTALKEREECVLNAVKEIGEIL